MFLHLQHDARVLCVHSSSFEQSAFLQAGPEPSRRSPHLPPSCCPQLPSHYTSIGLYTIFINGLYKQRTVQCIQSPNILEQSSNLHAFRAVVNFFFGTTREVMFGSGIIFRKGATFIPLFSNHIVV